MEIQTAKILCDLGILQTDVMLKTLEVLKTLPDEDYIKIEDAFTNFVLASSIYRQTLYSIMPTRPHITVERRI